jgi:hypothetical protein
MSEKRQRPGPGRPTKLTTTLEHRICTLVEVGNTVEVAARASGVSRDTVYEWLRRGELTGKPNAPYRAFLAAVDRAKAEREHRMVVTILKAAQSGSWQAARFLLERWNPDAWAPSSGREKPEAEPPAADPFAEVDDELARRRVQRA